MECKTNEFKGAACFLATPMFHFFVMTHPESSNKCFPNAFQLSFWNPENVRFNRPCNLHSCEASRGFCLGLHLSQGSSALAEVLHQGGRSTTCHISSHFRFLSRWLQWFPNISMYCLILHVYMFSVQSCQIAAGEHGVWSGSLWTTGVWASNQFDSPPLKAILLWC